MCGFDGDGPECSVEKTRKARKQHTCCECHLPIPVGAQYVHTSGIWDGEPSTFKQHVECHRLLRMIWDEYCGGEGMWLFGSLLEEIEEYEDEDTEAQDDEGEPVEFPEPVVIDRMDTGRPLHGPGHLHGALEAIRARYQPSPS